MGESKKEENCRTSAPEIDLVREVKSCRDCRWFWGDIPPYGPFNSFDWSELFPKALQSRKSKSKSVAQPWCDANLKSMAQIDPAVLRGCRKAPIMTLGINPNMTAFFADVNSSSWAYPSFERLANYAYYYRQASVHQESIRFADLQQSLIPGTQLYSPIDGFMRVNRSTSHRWMQLAFYAKKRDRQEHSSIEDTWNLEQRLVILNKHPIKGKRGLYRVKKGALIAGKIASTTEHQVELLRHKLSYYTRLSPTLKRLNKRLKRKGNKHIQLSIGEDISMNDMIACASPGWGERFDIPTEAIAKHCVEERGYVIKQLLQSRPRLIIVVSTASLTMFARAVEVAGGQLHFEYHNKDVFSLLKQSCAEQWQLTIPDGQTDYRARIVITPHFSYDDNFEHQSRLTVEAWKRFADAYPDSAKLLTDNDRVKFLADANYGSVLFDQRDDPLKNKIDPTLWRCLKQHAIDPMAELDRMFWNEHRSEPWTSSTSREHLDRSEGPCQFCRNDQWTFPEACPYGKC
ncbi:MAG: hypothetical protein ACPGSC_10190 [Granulosicoccaceae bacterium]